MAATNALVLFDIDGTLIRRAGPHHRQALVDAVRGTTGVETTTDGVPVAGMLDGDILNTMMRRAGMKPAHNPRVMPKILRGAARLYSTSCPHPARGGWPGCRPTVSCE